MIPPGYAKYEKNVSVACVNFQTKWGDKSANLKKIERITREAADLGADVIVFPELSLSGFECPERCAMHRDLAEPIPGPSTTYLLELTKSLDIYLVIGIPERDVKKPDTLYISCALLGPEGNVGVYRKLSFHARSAGCFKPGDSLPVFETRYGPVGMQTCSNLWLFPEFSRVLALKGARLILNPTASPSGPEKPLFLTTQTVARGTENGIYVASANLVGKEVNMSYYGHSCIGGPAQPSMSHLYAEAGGEEEIISAVLSFERLHAYRDSLTFPYGLPLPIVLRELNQIVAKWQEKDSIYTKEPLKGLVEKLSRA